MVPESAMPAVGEKIHQWSHLAVTMGTPHQPARHDATPGAIVASLLMRVTSRCRIEFEAHPTVGKSLTRSKSTAWRSVGSLFILLDGYGAHCLLNIHVYVYRLVLRSALAKEAYVCHGLQLVRGSILS